MREACYLKLLLVPMVLAIAVRWESMIPLLLSLAGLYLATEAFTALCPLPESSGVSTSTKCEQISRGTGAELSSMVFCVARVCA